MLSERFRRDRTLTALFAAALVGQNAIAIPYVRARGWPSVADFFVGDILKTTPGRFALFDLAFVVLSFHTWAFMEARRLGMLPVWALSFVMTFSVGIATAIPFFLVARERRLRVH
ncbi:MAG: DUF2834 domain-containing protein [Rhodococcus sp. (in: high G+C Gram-positive bacteria)]